MKFIEFIPVVLFFLVYKFPEKALSLLEPWLSIEWMLYLTESKVFVLATIVFIVATLVQIAITWAIKRKIDKMSLIILAIILVLGLPSILLNNPMVFMWKPTIVNWAFAIAFLLSAYIGKRRPIIQRMLSEQIQLPQTVWRRLNIAWVTFFAFSGALNLIVVYSFSEAIWVDFKLYGILGLTLIFSLAQGIYLAKHMQYPIEEK